MLALRSVLQHVCIIVQVLRRLQASMGPLHNDTKMVTAQASWFEQLLSRDMSAQAVAQRNAATLKLIIFI